MDRERSAATESTWELESKTQDDNSFGSPSVVTAASSRQIHLADVQLRSEFAANASERRRGRPELFATVSGGPSWRDARSGGSNQLYAASRPVAAIPAVGSPSGIEQALGEIAVDKTTRSVQMLDASEMFVLFPWNTPEKSRLFQQLKKSLQKVDSAKAKLVVATEKKAGKTGKKLSEAEKAEKTAEHNVAAAEKQQASAEKQVRQFLLQNLPRIERADATLTATRQKIGKLTKDIKKLKAAKNPAAATMEAELQQAKAKESQLHEGYLKQISETNLERNAIAQNSFRYTIDGETVKLTDSIEAYCTVSLQGTAGQGVSETGHSSVDKALDTSDLSSSQKKILRAISSSEGVFSSVNTYDKMNITWGFIQWAGADRSALVATLLSLKQTHPDTFADRFTRYGIDVDAKSQQLIVTGVDGSVKKGEDAGEVIQNSPTLTAVISRAGLDPVVQNFQLHAAAAQQIIGPLDQTVTVKSGDKSRAIALGEIFTSEYGAGVLADRSVHAGLGKGAIQQDLQNYVNKQNLDVDNVSEWADDAEQALIDSVNSGWADRAKKLEDQGCSKKAGTFVR